MAPLPGSTQDSVALDDDQRQVIVDIGSHDRELHHYGAVLNGYEIGRLDYTLPGHRVVLASTVIVSSFQNRGIATELIRRVLDDVRTTGKTTTILCPIVRAFIDRYPNTQI